MTIRFLLGLAFMAIITGMPARASTISFSDLLARKRPAADHKIAYGAERDQFGELWLPEDSGLHPVAVMIHGGCWQANLPGVELMAYIADDLRHHGVAVWNLEYRRLSDSNTGYPDTFLDIGYGVDYLRSLSAQFELDLSRVIVIGHSAGGHLGLWAAARGKLAARTTSLYAYNPLSIHTVITLAGINDLLDYRHNGPGACGEPDIVDRLVGSNQRVGEDPYADTSPAEMLPLGVKQVIVSGDLDSIVPASLGRAYGTLARGKGDDVETIELKNTGHFELIDPNSAAWAKIKEVTLSEIGKLKSGQ